MAFTTKHDSSGFQQALRSSPSITHNTLAASHRNGLKTTVALIFVPLLYLIHAISSVHLSIPWQRVILKRPLLPSLDSSTPFSWSDISPSSHLTYTSCFTHFQCARLSVPLNWNDTDAFGPSNSPRAAVAIIRLPAVVPVTDSRYGGAIITNPGGPGESGVHQVLTHGTYLRTIADADEALTDKSSKFFDIISFDPRGVNNTTPHLKCFPDAATEVSYLEKLSDYGLLWSSESVLGLEWGNAQALGQSCSRLDPDTGVDTVKYVNTAQTARDMLEIIEKIGEWREKEAQKELGAKVTIEEPKDAIKDRLRWQRDTEKIQYWGSSYGTTLGQTFASMFPHRISRMVLDGVMDAADYYAGTYMTNLRDSDKIITTYAQYCFQAGPDNCPLYSPTSSADIEARFERTMMDLKTNPIPIPGGGDSGPALLTYRDMHLRMLGAMYSSYSQAEDLFRLVAGIEARNTTIISECILGSLRTVPKHTKQCTRDGPFSDACVSELYVSGFGPIQAIACMDSAWNNTSSLTKQEFKQYTDDLSKLSKWISPSWSKQRLGCIGYSGHPAWTYEGAIGATPSYPILAIGNTHDSVCPLQNAIEITHLFPTSVVLQQDSEGHCFQSSPSTCTGRTIREYFQTGALPKNGSVCSPEYKPFIGCFNRDANGECKPLSSEDQRLFDAIAALT